MFVPLENCPVGVGTSRQVDLVGLMFGMVEIIPDGLCVKGFGTDIGMATEQPTVW